MMESVAMLILQLQLDRMSLERIDRYLAQIAPRDVIETIGRRV